VKTSELLDDSRCGIVYPALQQRGHSAPGLPCGEEAKRTTNRRGINTGGGGEGSLDRGLGIRKVRSVKRRRVGW